MHRSYQNILPCQNKLLQQKWDRKYYDEHTQKLKEAAPIVDTRAPQTYMHLHLKLKKLQLEEERLSMIERDNRILLEKMSYIMRTRGRIDNRNNYEYKSLSREKRQRELLHVTRENQAILQRILNRKPEYDREKWQREWEDNLKFMDSISAYPSDWWKSSKKRSNEEDGEDAPAEKKETDEKEAAADTADSDNVSDDEDTTAYDTKDKNKREDSPSADEDEPEDKAAEKEKKKEEE